MLAVPARVLCFSDDPPFKILIIFCYITQSLFLLWALMMQLARSRESDKEAICDPDWVFFEDACYFFSKGPLTQIEARSFCLDQGGDLVSIHGPEEQKFVEENVAYRSSWIGAFTTQSLIDDPWNFEFFDGTPNDYHQVGVGEGWIYYPGTPGGGILLRPLLLKNVDCALKRTVYCYSPYYNPQCGCGNGDFDFVAGTCLKKGPEPMSFEDANRFCSSLEGGCGAWGAVLPGSDDMRNIITGYYMSSDDNFMVEDDGDRPGRYWVDLRRNPESGLWETNSGSQVNVTGWHWDGFPTEDGGDCVSMFVSSWIPQIASKENGFICKKSLA
ncbi:unnamed protein product [Darwinula stevensoni]|uniref:C-type lectin domain-containing protein n=1 Tax=Darwinula stevensoni TaxID=69355 RepID=A0A7R9FRG0_9CRUS|nr:unnamed protein product [Darwinula stevensoni]CAG0901591.1 unnamed protein product [Darwinula stevensoni]